jgi:hypothetical protein
MSVSVEPKLSVNVSARCARDTSTMVDQRSVQALLALSPTQANTPDTPSSPHTFTPAQEEEKTPTMQRERCFGHALQPLTWAVVMAVRPSRCGVDLDKPELTLPAACGLQACTNTHAYTKRTDPRSGSWR